MRYFILFLVAAILVAAIAFFAWQGVSPPSPMPPDVPVQGLMPGQGRGLVLTNCGACHSTALVASFHTSREGWDAVITRMQEEEGLWGLTTEDREAMLNYLAATQGLTSSRLSDSPWAQPLYPPNPIW
jgi:mono/diheme cytochrome c family protein